MINIAEHASSPKTYCNVRTQPLLLQCDLHTCLYNIPSAGPAARMAAPALPKQALYCWHFCCDFSPSPPKSQVCILNLNVYTTGGENKTNKPQQQKTTVACKLQTTSKCHPETCEGVDTYLPSIVK